MNYFAPKSVAERYAKGRPYFHPQVVSRIKAYLSLAEPVARALDVGCGTGLSTIALKTIARHVVGVDNAAEMIALAPTDPQIEYFIAPAEKIPVDDNAFDLITISSAFHWMNRSAFFTEAHKILRSQGWLVVYDNYFCSRMEESYAFQAWARDHYLTKYPSPPRASVGFSAEDGEQDGFRLIGQEEYQNFVRFSLETLVDYLVTQSNISAAVEGGKERIEDVRHWLTENFAPFFAGRAEATFMFRGPIWYLRKTASTGAG
jgi:ubiquinone/menaquinone biosynthesis C-methylase UbiE